MKIVKNPFNSYRITYSIESHDTTDFNDYAPIDCYSGAQKVEQVLFGSSIRPGNNANLDNMDQINLYFPLTHFATIVKVLKLGGTQSSTADMGGITMDS